MKNSLKVFLVVMAVVSLAFVFAQSRRYLVAGTGGVTGVYYPVGGAIARIVNGIMANTPHSDLRLTVLSTDGSVDNLDGLQSRSLDFGLAQSDAVYQAYNGVGAFEGRQNEEVRVIMGLYSEPMHLVCNTNAGVRSFADIIGKRVNIGSPTSGMRSTVMTMLDAFGMTLDDFTAESARAVDAPAFLHNGHIDCFFYTVGIGADAIINTAIDNSINIVPLDGPRLRELVDEFPRYIFTTIPAGTYNGVDYDVTTFGTKALLVTTSSVTLPEGYVYSVVKGILDNVENFQNAHPALAQLTCADFTTGFSAPLHNGARRAYEETARCVLPEGL